MRPRGVSRASTPGLPICRSPSVASATPAARGTAPGAAFRPGIHQSVAARDPGPASWLASALKAEIDHDLVEWNYGEYEGLRTAEIHAKRPGWELFRDGCPGGESPAEVGARADRMVDRVRAVQQDVLIFSSGHFLRVLAARWLGLEPEARQIFPAEHRKPERA